MPSPSANAMYCLFAAHFRLVSSSSQAIAKKTMNRTRGSSFVYEVIVVYSSIAARTAKMNAVAAIANAANEIEGLD